MACKTFALTAWTVGGKARLSTQAQEELCTVNNIISLCDGHDTRFASSTVDRFAHNLQRFAFPVESNKSGETEGIESQGLWAFPRRGAGGQIGPAWAKMKCLASTGRKK